MSARDAEGAVSGPVAGRLHAVFGAAGARGFLHAVDLHTGAEASLDPDTPAVDASIGTAARAAVEDLRDRGAAAPSLAPG